MRRPFRPRTSRPALVAGDLPHLGRPAGLSRRSLCTVLLFAAAFLLPALGGRFRVLTLHEVFAAEPAREMLSGGHWVIPQFAGKPRTVKPPATGWLIAGSMALFRTEAEWAVRLPAALAGVATAGIVAWLAGRWMGDRAGLAAGLMQATFAYALMQARLAEADMPMCAAVALAMAAFAAGAVDMSADGASVADGAGQPPHADEPRDRARPPLPLALLFHVGAGLAFLFKGVGIVFVLLGCLSWVALPAVPALLNHGPWSAVGHRWRAAARLLFHPVGLPLLVAMVAAWPLAAWRQMPDIVTVWRRETLGRATGEFGPPDPWHVYFWSVPYLLLPWLPFAVAGGIGLWRGCRVRLTPSPDFGGEERTLPAAVPETVASSRLAFLACWFLGGMTLLTLSSFRHKHYAIPMLPPVTLLAAAGFTGWLANAPPPGRAGRRARWLPVGVVLAVGAIAVASLLAFAKQGKVELALTAVVVAVGVAATAGCYAAGRRSAVTAACFGTALAGGLAFQALVIPRFDDYRASADLARRANLAVPAGEPIYLVALGEAHPAFYLDHPLARVDKRTDIPAFVAGSAGDKDAYALCPASAVPLLAGAGRVTELDRVDHLRRTEKDPTVLVKVRAGPAATQAAVP